MIFELLSGLSLALVHKHVQMSVGKWILETTHPHRHVQIPEDDFFSLASLGMIVSHENFIFNH